MGQPEKHIEGAKKQVTVNAYERNPKARTACIAKYGSKCAVCEFDFEKHYGEIGSGYIHVHHLKPLASVSEKYEVDPIEDLRPVCPNCHAMLHKKEPPYSIEELQVMIRVKFSDP
ncbi:MAG: HNH endonuclease [Chloroflexi bacterium]|nr:HNH endonuclease [Chloroflexota bacterium]